MKYVGWWFLIFTAVLFALGVNDALNIWTAPGA